MSNQTTIDRLTRLLAYYENAAASLRTVIGIVSAPSTTGRPSSGLPGVLRDAIGLDAARRAGTNGATPHGAATGRRKPHPGRGGSGAYTVRMMAARRATAKALDGFDLSEPRAAADVLGKDKARHVGGMIRGGYVKRKGAGYVRTSKPFVIELRESRKA